MSITIVGGGLAGSEAAWQAASRGVPVKLFEMRPSRPTAVHKTDRLAELVCSNSFRGDKLDNAVGLLKEEMRRLDSLVMHAAEVARSLGMREIIVPLSPGILCALGLLVSDLKEDFVTTARVDLSAAGLRKVSQSLDALVAEPRGASESEVELLDPILVHRLRRKHVDRDGGGCDGRCRLRRLRAWRTGVDVCRADAPAGPQAADGD